MKKEELLNGGSDVAPDYFFSLMVWSEIVITAIVFIGVYYIFKPLMEKDKEEDKTKKNP